MSYRLISRMDPVSLFGIAAGVTFAGYSIGFGIKQALDLFRRRNEPPEDTLTLREVNIIPSTPIHLRRPLPAQPPSPTPML
jgi:hypothetical protein